MDSLTFLQMLLKQQSRGRWMKPISKKMVNPFSASQRGKLPWAQVCDTVTSHLLIHLSRVCIKVKIHSFL